MRYLMKKRKIVFVIFFSMLLTMGLMLIPGCSFCSAAFDCNIVVAQDGSSYNLETSCKNITCEVVIMKNSYKLNSGFSSYCDC